MENLLDPVSRERLKILRRTELESLFEGEQQLRLQMQNELDQIKAQYSELSESKFELLGKFIRIKSKLFGRSSEKSSAARPRPKQDKPKKPRSKSPKLPSERYPNAPIIEKTIALEDAPNCRQCGYGMSDAEMPEVSEYLTVSPRRYTVVRQLRSKYRCSCCHGDIQTAPGLPRIKPGSSFSDEMIIDIAMSKYCDLIPVERYRAMAAREGFEGLAANSLIEATHHLAQFSSKAFYQLKLEVLQERVVLADETTHRMLESHEKSRWHLWGFSGGSGCYFECHPTRSGDVALNFLRKSTCEVLVTDDFSGYGKAIRLLNKERKNAGETLAKRALCNAHARRKFKEAEESFAEQASFYLRCYRIIFRLESWGKKSSRLAKNRQRMAKIFENMKAAGAIDLEAVSSKSGLATAIKYLTSNYSELTLFLGDERIPIDNNAQERALRSPVIGRKTWYGTHSIKGAATAACLFSLVESCKMNRLNPRQYFKSLVNRIHQGEPPITPAEFLRLENST